MLSIFTASKCKALLIWNHKQKVVEKTLHIWEPRPRLHGAPCITCSMLHPIYNKVSANTPPRAPLSYVILGNVPAISSLAFKGMGETITWTGGLNLEFMMRDIFFHWVTQWSHPQHHKPSVKSLCSFVTKHQVLQTESYHCSSLNETAGILMQIETLWMWSVRALPTSDTN